MSLEATMNYRRIDGRVTTSGAVPIEVLGALKADGYEVVINLMPDDSDWAVPGEAESVAAQACALQPSNGAPRVQLAQAAWHAGRALEVVRAIAEGRSDRARKLLWGCQSFVVAVMVVYFGALYFAWPLLESWIFKGRYEGVEQMTLAWSVHAFISVSEASLSMFLQAAYRLKELAYISMIAASVSSALLLGLTLDIAPIYAVVAVIMGELIVLVLTIRLVWQVLARLAPETSAATGSDHAGSQ